MQKWKRCFLVLLVAGLTFLFTIPAQAKGIDGPPNSDDNENGIIYWSATFTQESSNLSV